MTDSIIAAIRHPRGFSQLGSEWHKRHSDESGTAKWVQTHAAASGTWGSKRVPHISCRALRRPGRTALRTRTSSSACTQYNSSTIGTRLSAPVGTAAGDGRCQQTGLRVYQSVTVTNNLRGTAPRRSGSRAASGSLTGHTAIKSASRVAQSSYGTTEKSRRTVGRKVKKSEMSCKGQSPSGASTFTKCNPP